MKNRYHTPQMWEELLGKDAIMASVSLMNGLVVEDGEGIISDDFFLNS